MRSFWKREGSQARPEAPEDGELLAYLDGQLSDERRAQIDEELRASWTLRARLAEIESGVAEFVRTLPPPEGVPPFDTVWGEVRQRIDAPDGGGRQAPRWRIPAGAIAASLAALMVYYLVYPSTMSAKELVAKVAQIERAQLRAVRNPVVHQKLRVVRKKAGKSELATWEQWNAVDAGKFRRLNSQGETDVYQDLLEVYRANGFDESQPLSIGSYEQWRDRVHPEETVVAEPLPGGGDGLALRAANRHASQANDIIRADLLIRTSDWRPALQRLTVNGAAGAMEYEISEAQFQVTDLALLPPTVFAPVEAAAPPPPVEPGKSLLVAAVDAAFILHRMGACRTESLELAVAGSEIRLSGAVRTAERREAILAALARVPHLRAQVEVDGRPESPWEGAPEAEPGDRVELTAQVLALHSSLGRDVAALRRLASDFPRGDADQLPFASAYLLQKMIADHVAAIEAGSGKLNAKLRPVLMELSGGADSPPPAADRPAGRDDSVLRLAASVEESGRLVEALFGGGVPLPDVKGSAARLLSRLQRDSVLAGEARAAIGSDSWRASGKAKP